jgi:D-xylose transport system permease protein
MRLSAAPERAQSLKLGRALESRAVRMLLVLALLWLGLGLHPETREQFLTAGNFANLTAQIAEIVILGVGMTMVILVGGIDLSVGAGIALTGVVAAKLQIDGHQPAWIACAAALAVGALVGVWHGVLVSVFRVPAFIATLSGLLAYRGVGLLLSHARGLSPMGDDFQLLGGRVPVGVAYGLVAGGLALATSLTISRERRRRALGLEATPGLLLGLRACAISLVALALAAICRRGMPVPLLVAIAVTALGALLLRRTRLGRFAFAVGGNAEAARLSGVPVGRTVITVYVLMGLLTGLAGIVMAARANGVSPGNAGLTRELHVITAVVIGGTSLTGGRATMIGTVIGALIFGTLSNGMTLMGIDSNWQPILTGAILLGASLTDAWSAKKRHA